MVKQLGWGKRVLATLACSIVGLGAATATPISTDTWYVGFFQPTVGAAVTGAGSDGGGAVDAQLPPWTFSITDSHLLTVLDCCAVGDRFSIFNFGSLLGVTSVATAGGCLTAADCDALSGVGRGDFLLGPGFYEISMTVFSTVGVSGNLFFRVANVSDVPEPGTLALLGFGLLGLGLTRRKAA